MRSTTADPSATGGTRDTITGPVSSGAPLALDPDVAPAGSPAQMATGRETRTGRFRRKAHRTRLHGYAIAAVALVAYLIALAATNTAHVKVNWGFGSSPRLARLAGAVRGNPRLVARARDQRQVPLAHPRPAPRR